MTVWDHKTGKSAAKTRKAKRHRHVDVERTKEARDRKYFLDKRSFFDIEGDQFRYGDDMVVMHDAILARDRFSCVHCGREVGLEIHHIIPRGSGGPDNFDNLETICSWCHSKLHRVPGARQRRADLASHGTLLLLVAASCAMLFLGACSKPVNHEHEVRGMRIEGNCQVIIPVGPKTYFMNSEFFIDSNEGTCRIEPINGVSVGK